MAKFTILGSFTDDTITRVVPPEFRDLVRLVAAKNTPYTVVQFGHDRTDVVDSATVRRALARVDKEDAVLAVAGNFTREALALLEGLSARVARLGEFYWTDDSVHALPG